MATIRISATEAVRDFAALLARVRAGTEVVIEDESSAPVILRTVTPSPGRLLSESIALAEAHVREADSNAVMDAGFAADMKEILSQRKPRDRSAWD